MTKALLWILAFFITISLAIYQRKTGPTYPVDGSIELAGHSVSYNFTRSHGGPGDQEVSVFVSGDGLDHAELLYRRYRSSDDFVRVEMLHAGENYTAFLPHQPPAGKLEYQVQVSIDGETRILPEQPVVTRFKGAVPAGVLVPHVFMMFAAVLLSVRIGLGLFAKEDVKRLVFVTVFFLFLGGLILGPLVQKYAFGELWTGVPFGWDLTDNKTLLAFLAWMPAVFLIRADRKHRIATAFAVLVMLAVYLVPHSVWGSEFDYEKGAVTTGRVEETAP